ncbi:hypothetical protein [Pseudovibrio sp. Tun.PSC04-5.I4]|uniref:hypothetical protein n=1 Tax=Pseudovibrio sp. Tun.PSC04-5.I4 TaxID=1798213 RepID=UPI000881BF6C|nr:hypothetical protein [Pseudovibrio sp. Tun.PSC04-5.I4]SDR24519.1 hypothetical protein SAMN04515695_3736 [Pseudovibrio sp. Tun.PSC04-5.I4]
MAVLMKFKGIEQVYKETGKIEAALTKAKVDDEKQKAFIKELLQKRKRVEDKFLDEVNNDPKLKNFKAQTIKGDGGYTKALKDAADRLPVELKEASGKVTLVVGKNNAVGT